MIIVVKDLIFIRTQPQPIKFVLIHMTNYKKGTLLVNISFFVDKSVDKREDMALALLLNLSDNC